MAVVAALLVLYAVGAAVALVRTDGGPLERVVLAVFWPVGPVAFAVTVAVLLAASLIAFPAVAVPAAAAAAAAWWLLG